MSDVQMASESVTDGIGVSLWTILKIAGLDSNLACEEVVNEMCAGRSRDDILRKHELLKANNCRSWSGLVNALRCAIRCSYSVSYALGRDRLRLAILDLWAKFETDYGYRKSPEEETKLLHSLVDNMNLANVGYDNAQEFIATWFMDILMADLKISRGDDEGNIYEFSLSGNFRSEVKVACVICEALNPGFVSALGGEDAVLDLLQSGRKLKPLKGYSVCHDSNHNLVACLGLAVRGESSRQILAEAIETVSEFYLVQK